MDNLNAYLLFRNFKGFQIVAYNTEFFFEFDDFAVKKKKNPNLTDMNNTENGM